VREIHRLVLPSSQKKLTIGKERHFNSILVGIQAKDNGSSTGQLEDDVIDELFSKVHTQDL
jgi:hypothetical protein